MPEAHRNISRRTIESGWGQLSWGWWWWAWRCHSSSSWQSQMVHNPNIPCQCFQSNRPGAKCTNKGVLVHCLCNVARCDISRRHMLTSLACLPACSPSARDPFPCSLRTIGNRLNPPPTAQCCRSLLTPHPSSLRTEHANFLRQHVAFLISSKLSMRERKVACRICVRQKFRPQRAEKK